MSIEETCKWVEGLLEPPPGGLSSAQRSQLDMVQNAFRKHQVDGEILTDLSEDNLINDIGIPKVAAMVILTAIRQQQTAASTAPEPEPEAAAGGMSPPPSCFPAPVSDGHCFLSADGTGIVVAHMLELGDGCASLCVDGEASAIIAVVSDATALVIIANSVPCPDSFRVLLLLLVGHRAKAATASPAFHSSLGACAATADRRRR